MSSKGLLFTGPREDRDNPWGSKDERKKEPIGVTGGMHARPSRKAAESCDTSFGAGLNGASSIDRTLRVHEELLGYRKHSVSRHNEWIGGHRVGTEGVGWSNKCIGRCLTRSSEEQEGVHLGGKGGGDEGKKRKTPRQRSTNTCEAVKQSRNCTCERTLKWT
jgi:hypothetical protein